MSKKTAELILPLCLEQAQPYNRVRVCVGYDKKGDVLKVELFLHIQYC